MNKDAPLFLLDSSPKTQEFAVSLKESARSLKNVISSVTPDDNGELLSQKTVSSSDESIVTASFIGDTKKENDVASLEIEVKSLANTQVNIGKYLPQNEMGLEPGSYSFDVNSRDTDYEFQFNINDGDTNKTIEEKLARLITKSNIGIRASTVTDENGNMALRLESDESGIRNDSELQFKITDDNTSKVKGAVNYFGLSNVSEKPENSLFILNGEERSTQSNTFTIDKKGNLKVEMQPKGGLIVEK